MLRKERFTVSLFLGEEKPKPNINQKGSFIHSFIYSRALTVPVLPPPTM